jgi:hypothetical protein
MVRRLAAAAVAVATLSLGLAGCGSDTPGTSGAAGTTTTSAKSGGGDAVAWADKVCSAVGPEIATFSTPPNIDPTNPQKAKDSFVTFLEGMVKALDRMVSGIKDAGAPPVADGETAADRVVAALEQAKSAVGSAKDNLAKVDVSDPAAFQAAFAQVGTDMGKLGDLEDPTKGLRGNEELNAAFEKAESCKALGGSGSSSTPTS